MNVHACIPEALAKMIGIKTLTIGYTKDIGLAEQIARATGAKELLIETRPEGNTLMLNTEEQAEWRNRGWTLEGRTAKKTLIADIVNYHLGDESERERKRRSDVQSTHLKEGYSEGGRLKADMLFEMGSEGRDEEKAEHVSSHGDDHTDDDGNESGDEMDDESTEQSTSVYKKLRTH